MHQSLGRLRKTTFDKLIEKGLSNDECLQLWNNSAVRVKMKEYLTKDDDSTTAFDALIDSILVIKGGLQIPTPAPLIP